MAELLASCFDIDLPLKHEQSVFEPSPLPGHVFVSKSPHDILVANRALQEHSDVYIIYMLRDPRDVISSRHNLSPDRYWVGLNLWNSYTDIADGIVAHPRFIRISYESLVCTPDMVQWQLCDALPFLRVTASFSTFDRRARPSEDSLRALGGLRAVTPASIGNWRRHLSRVKGQLVRHGSITNKLLVYGYETDPHWERVLEGVTADMTESCWPDDAHVVDYPSLRRAVAGNAAIVGDTKRKRNSE